VQTGSPGGAPAALAVVPPAHVPNESSGCRASWLQGGKKRRQRWLGKTNFAEWRNFLHLYHSFNRLWAFLLLMLQVPHLCPDALSHYPALSLTMDLHSLTLEHPSAVLL